MPMQRRRFIKQAIGTVSFSLMVPHIKFNRAFGQNPSERRIFVIIELPGGNDGLNTVIPFTDSRYHAFRPNLSFKEAELKDNEGQTTLISDRFGLHPNLSGIKQLYDEGKAAIILGVGYPNPNGSHFQSANIWHAASLDGRGEGWLGKYAAQILAGRSGFPALSVAGSPGTFRSTQFAVPNISSFDSFGLTADQYNPDNFEIRTDVLAALYKRGQSGSNDAVRRTGSTALRSLELIKQAATDTSPIFYPEDNALAQTLKAIASLIVTIPEASLLYVRFGGFDSHAGQIDSPTDKLSGFYPDQLGRFSEAVKLFHDDLSARLLADNVVILQWSEFGRRPQENGSLGTDHGTASSLFVIGNRIRGGIYGEQPSLAATDLDDGGNMKFTVDFRAIYATILDRWMGADSQTILEGRFENIGFLG